ncbi:hypothetical protein AB0D12_31910 [Streptomyces sp. NPDC048479]|uniref:hypothetical protein n=1 Tax=Streptomyces sp. NPDC048479 TaxID=3154725 RepID=UPI003418E300
MPSTTPHSRRARITAVLTALTAVTFTLTAMPAQAAGPAYSGKGWKANTTAGVYSFGNWPYTIVYADATARTKLRGYFNAPAAQLTSVTGLKFTNSTIIDTTPVGSCPAKGRIVVHYQYRPTGQKSISHASPCYMPTSRAAAGGHVQMDSEYWTVPGWFSSNAAINEYYRKNLVTHELGHMALAHPNRDINRDGKVANYECDKNTSGWYPVMCSPHGGARSPNFAGLYTPYDVTGLKQMAANWSLRGN